MAAILEVYGTVAKVENGEITCPDARVRELLALELVLYEPGTEEPDRDGAIARVLAERLGGTFVSSDYDPEKQKVPKGAVL